MKTTILGAAIAAMLSTAAAADHHGHAGGHIYQQYLSSPDGNVVYVQCFRGPWRETIWDHPTARFIDSLVSVGYDIVTAESIANRVCKDVTLVGDPNGLRATMERIIAQSPRYGS